LYDQLEWDINDTFNSPETFSHSLCVDLGLSREFEVCISHSIREQLSFYKQAMIDSKLETVDFYRRPVPLTTAIRKEEELYQWTPIVGSTSHFYDQFGRKRYQEMLSPYKHLYKEKKKKKKKSKQSENSETQMVEDKEGTNNI